VPEQFVFMPTQSSPARIPAGNPIPGPDSDWLRLAGGVLLAAGAVAAYRRTFSVPLLFDDSDAIVTNLTIRHWGAAFWPPPDTAVSGRPLLNLTLAANHAISGTAVWSYHAFNLAIHVLAGLTLFGIVRRTLRLRSGPALGRRAEPAATFIGLGSALLWTLHPLQTESVTYIVQRAESLVGLLYLGTLYCFIRAICAERANASGPHAGRAMGEDGSRADSLRKALRVPGDSGGLPDVAQASQPASSTDSKRASWTWFALCVATCLLGMAAKEVMVSVPVVVLLYDRALVAGSFREAWRRRWGLYVALAATWLPLFGLVASTGWSRNGMAGFGVGIPVWGYWLTQFEAIVRYLWLSVWPHPLVFEYGTFWVSRPIEAVPYALVVGGLAVGSLVALWRRPVLGLLGFWFFAILAPTSVMPNRLQMIVEHRMYLALAPVVIAGVAGLHALLQKRQDDGPLVLLAPLFALALGLGLLTARRNEDYRSELAIWSDTVAKRPNNERARNNLGNAWSKTPGGLPDAIAEYQAALSLQPDFADAHNNLGLALAGMPGRLPDAIAQFEAALRLQPDDAAAHANLGLALAQQPGRLPDAIAEFREALRLRPDSAEAHTNLGIALAGLPGRLPEAVAEYEEALRLQPDLAAVHTDLGLALARLPGRLPDAVSQFEATVRLEPDSAGAHYNLGVALGQLPGRLPDAIAQYQEALRLNPNDARAWHNLGLSWYHLGDFPAAAKAFREELRLRPDDPAARQALAAALQRTGGH
jgi:tetratricopeptide (TPR) repeat protein